MPLRKVRAEFCFKSSFYGGVTMMGSERKCSWAIETALSLDCDASYTNLHTRKNDRKNDG